LNDFSRRPFFKLFLPLTAGILLNLYFNLRFHNQFVFFACAFTMLIIMAIMLYRNILKRFFVFIAMLFLMMVGIHITSNSRLNTDAQFYGHYIHSDSLTFAAVVDDIPIKKAKTYKVLLRVLEVKEGRRFIAVDGNVMAYFQKSVNTHLLKPGNVLLIKSRLNEIGKPLNPHTFDFKTYFNDQGIYYSSFIDSLGFSLVKKKVMGDVRTNALNLKYYIIESLKTSGLSNEAFAMCSALLTGFDDEIDKNVRESFAHSGTLHVLSVSGLHVGLIYAIISFLFARIDRAGRYNRLQFVCSISILWSFALMTGFAPPVTRAVLMFSLLGIGRLFFRHKPFNSLNILFVSAFIMLLAQPLLIRNAGFLLSYSALFGILFFYPKFEKRIEVNNRLLKYVWQSTCISLAATLTTLPITLTMFHQLPLLFIPANIVVVPAVFVMLVLAIPAVFKLKIFVVLLNVITNFLLSFISLFNYRGIAFIDQIDFTLTDAVLLSGLILTLTLSFVYRRYFYVLCSLIGLISWQLYGLMDSYLKKSENQFYVYQIPKHSVIAIKKGRTMMLNQLDSLNYSIHIEPSVIRANYPNLMVKPFNYYQNKEFVFFNCTQKNLKHLYSPKPITHLLVSNNAIPHEDLIKQHPIKICLADGSCSKYYIRKLKNMCQKNNIAFYATSEKGAYLKSD
jgi:competence protein ComEC